MKVKLKLKREDVSHLREIVNFSRFEDCLSIDQRTIELLGAKDEDEAHDILQRISYAIYNGINEALANNPKGE